MPSECIRSLSSSSWEAVKTTIGRLRRDASFRRQGLGLNLMACYFIVYHHGGRIHLQSGGTAQSCLTITLPVRPTPGGTRAESEAFLVRAMTNERLWERLQSGV